MKVDLSLCFSFRRDWCTYHGFLCASATTTRMTDYVITEHNRGRERSQRKTKSNVWLMLAVLWTFNDRTFSSRNVRNISLRKDPNLIYATRQVGWCVDDIYYSLRFIYSAYDRCRMVARNDAAQTLEGCRNTSHCCMKTYLIWAHDNDTATPA